MRHGMANRKLGRTSSHRSAMFRNQISSMIDKERIVTTLIKAKELRPLVEKMITLGREDSVHTRRMAAQTISDDKLVQKLFTDLGPRFANRNGGYTRIIKMGPRRGDNSEMAILEFVDFEGAAAKKAAPPAVETKKAKKSDDTKSDEAAEKPAKKKAAPKKEAAADEKKPKKAAKKKKEE